MTAIAYAVTARAGFAWYEFDITYYILKLPQAEVRDQLPAEVKREGGLA